MKKISFYNVFMMIAVAAMIFSCKKSADVAPPATVNNIQLTGEIANQLQLAKENLAAHKINAAIISYQSAPAIADDAALQVIKTTLLSENNFVPQYDGTDAASFKVNTIGQRMNSYRQNPDNEQNVVENLRQQVLPAISTGQQVLTINWNADGKNFTTTCIYNDQGVVYDNMLSNISFMENATTASDDIKLSADNSRQITNPATNEKQYSFTATARDVTIKWVWGSTRGKVVIKHYIIWNGSNYIYDHGGTVDAWMSVGSASGRWANNYLSRSSRSKMAWGYGWATPTASFSIKYNSSSITFSASTSGVGSKGSGDGIHTIYL